MAGLKEIVRRLASVKNTKKITYAMSNSFGFGGHNASLLFKKV